MSLEMKYFVLKPKAKTREDHYAKASQLAMQAYAQAIKKENPSLAEELEIWVTTESVNQSTKE